MIRKLLTRRQAVRFIHNTNGLLFAVIFKKRTDGSKRHMVARTGVTKHLKGGPRAYDFKEYGLIPVFDMLKAAYRSVPIEGILRIKVAGKWFVVQ